MAAWYDVSAFTAAPVGRFGSAERGSIVGPGLNLWHLGVHKRFKLSDRAGAPSLRVELTSTNAFNMPQYGNPNVNVTPTNVSAGRISSIGGTAGAIQQAGMRSMRMACAPSGKRKSLRIRIPPALRVSPVEVYRRGRRVSNPTRAPNPESRIPRMGEDQVSRALSDCATFRARRHYPSDGRHM